MIIELKTLDQIDPCQLAYHANEQSIGNYLRNSFPYPYTLDHAMSFITHSLENHGLDFGIVVDGICVGCIGGTLHNDIDVHNCELGYWLNPAYANKGIMKQAVKLFAYMFLKIIIFIKYMLKFLQKIWHLVMYLKPISLLKKDIYMNMLIKIFNIMILLFIV